MPPVIHPIWLLLLLCGFLFLLGCSVLPPRTPTRLAPTVPSVTLTVYRYPSLQPAQTSVPLTPDVTHEPPRPPRPSSSPVYAEIPTCYARPDGGFICLGRVWNTSDQPVSNVQLMVSPVTAAGEMLSTERISLEQRYIKPHDFAPYRAIFADIPALPDDILAEVITADEMLTRPLPISVQEQAAYRDAAGRYGLTAIISHEAPAPQRIQTVMTLLDEDEHVLGYRVQLLPDALPPRQPRIITLHVNPQVMTDTLWHHLHTEAR